MATKLSASLHLIALATLVPDPAAAAGGGGAVAQNLENATRGRRWTQGIASGQVDRVFKKIDGSLAASASDSYDLLAAGSLTDVLGQTIDADELKGLMVKCVTGDIVFEAPAANGLPCFKAATHGIKLSAGQAFALDFGAAGLPLGTDAQFDITETSTTTAATYELWAIVAQ